MARYLQINQIERLQIEPTSYCNLLCTRCSRTEQGGLNPRLPLAELNPDQYQNIFSIPKLNQQFKEILFNGNYGDPIASKFLIEGLSTVRAQTNASIRIHTNGSLRPPSFWQELAKMMTHPNDRLVFSIDGLADTNSIYRVNSQFDKIIENAEAFISAGGSARWDFLRFEHNFHQEEDVKLLAKKMGFIEFNAKATARPAIKTDGKHSTSEQLNSTITKHGSWDTYIRNTPINCKFKMQVHSLFVDFLFRLWPCCWIAGPQYFADKNDPRRKEIEAVLGRYEKDFNDLNKYSLEEILAHPWFHSELTSSWSNDGSSHKKLRTCARMCGKEFEASSGVLWKNSNLSTLQQK